MPGAPNILAGAPGETLSGLAAGPQLWPPLLSRFPRRSFFRLVTG